MLSDMLEASLATPVGERHKFQAEIVTLPEKYVCMSLLLLL